MKFDLEKAKMGHPVELRNGTRARIICFDRIGKYPVIVLTKMYGEEYESVENYGID